MSSDDTISSPARETRFRVECIVQEGGSILDKPKPDDRSDNVDKLQEQVVNTIENLEEAHEQMDFADMPEEQREAILAKNRRREAAIEGKREEIQDEYADQLHTTEAHRSEQMEPLEEEE